MARYMLMKLTPYKGQSLLGGFYLSEKLDGIRVLWDGGCTRGRPKRSVPWANCMKDDRYKEEVYCTGLWTQYGNPIQAPDWFLDSLPPALLEGELFAGRGQFQKLTSAVKKLTPLDDEWEGVRFVAFDAPSIHRLFSPGKVSMHSNTSIVWKGALTYFLEYGDAVHRIEQDVPYMIRRNFVTRYWSDNIMNFEKMIFNVLPMVKEFDRIIEGGGEGVVMKHRENIWTTDRAKDVFKHKPFNDAEATLIGFTDGKGKYEGMVGAYVCQMPDGKTFELSGMTDELRSNPPELGVAITYKYRELSVDGLPKEARFVRFREDAE